MRLRTQLILAFFGLAVVPLTAITFYSYRSSLNALHAVAEKELSSMASDMSSRMEAVSGDMNRRLERFAAFEFRRIMSLDKKDRAAATENLVSRLKAQMGENAAFLKSMEFSPAGMRRFPPAAATRMPYKPGNQAMPGSAPDKILIDLSGEQSRSEMGSPQNDRYPPLPPFPGGRFATEVRNGNELIGKVSAEISSRQLLHSVLMRTQPRQGEIPFAVDAEGKPYATNPADLQKIKSLSLTRLENKAGAQQQVATSQDWVIVTRKDSLSGLAFGIARPIGDRLGDLRRATARNMGYGLGVIALSMIGIIPISGRMTRNLTVLTKEAGNLADGDLAARVRITSNDEFGKLGEAFNRMAEDLSENQKRLIEQEGLHKELEMCRRIQVELLPRKSLRSGAVEVKGVSIPAREVGGDFFNYFPMPDGNLALLVGDVSGKGLPAALLMANLQATIQARLPLELELVKLAEKLDNDIAANNAEAYLTIFMAVLDSKSLVLRYVNAGHNPQFLLHRDGSSEQLQSTGRPLGLLAGGGFQEIRVPLQKDDSLFFYTDGLVEAQNEAGEEFGMARLENLLIVERSRGLEGMLAKVEDEICKHRGGIEAADDATMMILKISRNGD
jgi:serine phosphatase RsbU (regulator of sigma subunit)